MDGTNYDTAIADLMRLDRLCYSDSPLTLDQWHQITARADYQVFAGLDDNNNRIGYGIGRTCREGDSDCLKLLRLGVDPGCRRRGVARGLLQQLAGVNVELELRETNVTALKAAVACGFAPVGVHRGRFDDCDGVLLYRQGK